MKRISLLIVVLMVIFLNTGCIKQKAPNCESQIVKNMALDIVKKNDTYFESINPDTISKVYLKDTLATSYNKDIDKYSCKAQFVVESTDSGFYPKELDGSNVYSWNFVYYDWDGLNMKKNTKYICDIEYSSQLLEGKPHVESSHCNSIIESPDSLFGIWKIGNFSCEGENCRTILLKKSSK